MQEPPHTWRELLGSIIKNPKEKERLAHALNINPLTLTRWVNNETDPRTNNLHQLLVVLPQHRSVLLESIRQEFEYFSDEVEGTDDLLPEIPASFFARVLRDYSILNDTQLFWSLGNLILQQAINQLDPHQSGMICVLVQCLPPLEGNKIQSMRITLRAGTPPWIGYALNRSFLSGSESLAGYVISTSLQPLTIQDVDEDGGIFPLNEMKETKSLTIYPIRRAGRTAGCFSVACSQPRYFSRSRVALIQQYADLLGLVLREEEFYEPEQIALVMMPSPKIQEPYMLTFQQRLSQVMRERALQGRPIVFAQAELVVWHQLQEELRELAFAPEA